MHAKFICDPSLLFSDHDLTARTLLFVAYYMIILFQFWIWNLTHAFFSSLSAVIISSGWIIAPLNVFTLTSFSKCVWLKSCTVAPFGWDYTWRSLYSYASIKVISTDIWDQQLWNSALQIFLLLSATLKWTNRKGKEKNQVWIEAVLWRQWH